MHSSFTWTPSWQHRQNFRRRADEERSADFFGPRNHIKVGKAWKGISEISPTTNKLSPHLGQGISSDITCLFTAVSLKKNVSGLGRPQHIHKKKQSKDMAESSNEGCDHATAWPLQVICTQTTHLHGKIKSLSGASFQVLCKLVVL